MKAFKLWMKTGWTVWNYEEDCDMVIIFYKVLLSLWDENEYKAKPFLTIVEDCIFLCVGLCDKEQKKILLHDDCFDVKYCNKWKIVQNKLRKS